VAYNKNMNKVAVMKRGRKERSAFGHGYEVLETNEVVNEEPPCRQLYKTWMNGCDRYNKYLYQLKPVHFVKGWKQSYFQLFLRMCITNSWVMHSELNSECYHSLIEFAKALIIPLVNIHQEN